MSGVTFTIARKAGGGLLSKKISLGADGKPHSDGSPCRMWAREGLLHERGEEPLYHAVLKSS